jgi:hypothetical protein
MRAWVWWQCKYFVPQLPMRRLYACVGVVTSESEAARAIGSRPYACVGVVEISPLTLARLSPDVVHYRYESWYSLDVVTVNYYRNYLRGCGREPDRASHQQGNFNIAPIDSDSLDPRAVQFTLF